VSILIQDIGSEFFLKGNMTPDKILILNIGNDISNKILRKISNNILKRNEKISINEEDAIFNISNIHEDVTLELSGIDYQISKGDHFYFK